MHMTIHERQAVHLSFIAFNRGKNKQLLHFSNLKFWVWASIIYMIFGTADVLNSAHFKKALFTLGARALVPGHRHKMVLCSDTGYPIYHCPVQCPSSGTGTVPEFWRGYLIKWCVQISAHQESCSGTVLGHQV